MGNDAKEEWKPIETAPKGESVLLYAGKHCPIYCGEERYGRMGEPQENAFAWRCDSSGRFAHPTFWHPIPVAPAVSDKAKERGMKFYPGDTVRTTKGDRLYCNLEDDLEIIKYGNGWRKYANVQCLDLRTGLYSYFLEKNLVLVRGWIK